MSDPFEDYIKDLRDRIGHAEAWATANMVNIQNRAEADKNKAWNDMLAGTRDLRRALDKAQTERDETFAANIVSIGLVEDSN